MRKKNHWFKLNRNLHRDIGYLCVGLTVIYALSGVAVNHIEDWNPSYNISVKKSPLPINLSTRTDEKIAINIIRQQFGINSTYKSSYEESAGVTKYFFQDTVVTANTPNNSLLVESTIKRPFLFQANYLHLNHAKKYWTWIADIYALLLLYLALSGLFMVKGRKGVFGRGGYLVLAGVLLPIFVLAFI